MSKIRLHERTNGGGIPGKQTSADIVKTKPLLEIANKPWEMFLVSDTQEQEIALLRKHERTGRPLGGDYFVDYLL